MKDLNIKAVIEIRSLNFAAKSDLNKSLDSTKPRNLCQLSSDPIFIKVLKRGHKSGLEFLGFKLMTQSSFELLYQFSNQMKKGLSIYLDNPVIKEGKEFYNNLVK